MNRPERFPLRGQKVSHISTVHPAFDVRIFHKECRSLAQAGFDVNFVVTHIRDEAVEQVSIVRLPKTPNRAARMLVNPFLALRRALGTGSVIFHIHDPELVPVGLLLKLAGKKVIYDAHEDLPRQILSKTWIDLRLRRLVAAVAESVEDFAATRFDWVVAATPTIGERFLKLNANTIVLNNYPLTREMPELAEWEGRERAACYFGVISSGRGIEEIIRALEFTDATLHLAGPVSEPAFLKRLQCLPAWSRVRYHGILGRGQVMGYMAGSRIGLACLHPEPNHVDSQPIKVYEYWGAGLPIVASNFPRWMELIEGNRGGLCVDPMDPARIASAINYLLENDNEARRMGQNGRRLVETTLNWNSEEEKLLSLYDRLVDSRVLS
jgi:glycosyltransferase involved in cell wall biosynthesis